MELHINLPDWLKIPLKILIPAVWMFSGALLLAPDTLLVKLNLLTWKNEHGFWLGLVFLILSCLAVVYLAYYMLGGLIKFLEHVTRDYRTMKRLSKLSDIEINIILRLYSRPDHSDDLNFNNPITAGLLQQGFLYTARTQFVTVQNDNSVPIRCTLQPFVWQALDSYRDKGIKVIKKLEKKYQTAKGNKKEKIRQKLDDYEDFMQRFMQEDK